MKKILILSISLLLISACEKTEISASESEIYLVRHFQKQERTAKSGSDVALTGKGYENANRLATHLQGKNISSIYSTDYTRTLQTASPFSELINIPITIYNPKELEAFAGQLLGTHKNLLVVGHSNTTGVLFGLLGCESIVLSEKDYGDIMVVKLLHKNSESKIESCTRYQLSEQIPDIDNILFVKQSDLQKYFTQTNVTIRINNVRKTDSSENGAVEVGFIINGEGNTSSFEIVKSSPEGSWHEQALDAAKQLQFSPTSVDLPMGKSVYTTWVFEFAAN